MVIEDATNRFSGADWYPEIMHTSVTVGGAGGTGSWLALFLARMGCNIALFDFDRVEEHNFAGQYFHTDGLYKPKTYAVKEAIQRTVANKTANIIEYERFLKDTPVNAICAAVFDKMSAREDMFETWVKQQSYHSHKEKLLFIDSRVSLEQIQIFCVKYTERDIEAYRKSLFSDDEIEETVCTLRQTTHTSAMVAAHITAFITNHVANYCKGVEYREVPVYFEYFIPQNLTISYLNNEEDL
jgi:hypothetical protein